MNNVTGLFRISRTVLVNRRRRMRVVVGGRLEGRKAGRPASVRFDGLVPTTAATFRRKCRRCAAVTRSAALRPRRCEPAAGESAAPEALDSLSRLDRGRERGRVGGTNFSRYPSWQLGNRNSMSGDDNMDTTIAGHEDDDRVRDGGCRRSECKRGARSSKASRHRSAEAADFYQRRLVDITRDKPIKVVVRVALPVRDHPKFNFVGKLLGPKGNSLKRLQEDTMTKMAILGRGSMRDRHKEEELRNSGDPRFSHLSDELHVEVTASAPPAEAHARIAYALSEVRRFLVPDYNDEIRQEQMWEMRVLNGSSSPYAGDDDAQDDDDDDDDDDDNNDEDNNNNNHRQNNHNNNNNNDDDDDDDDDGRDWTNKNVESRRSSGGVSVKNGAESTCGQPTSKSSPTQSLRSRSRLYATHPKTNGAICLNHDLAPSHLETSTIAPHAASVLNSIPAPTSGLSSVQHPAARGFKNKSVVALASSSLPAFASLPAYRIAGRCSSIRELRTPIAASPTATAILRQT